MNQDFSNLFNRAIYSADEYAYCLPMDWATMVFPGEFCHTSGVYKVVHYQHRLPHHVTVNEAEPFPVCRRCQSKVRYFRTDRSTKENVPESAVLIVDDPDLSGTFANI